MEPIENKELMVIGSSPDTTELQEQVNRLEMATDEKALEAPDVLEDEDDELDDETEGPVEMDPKTEAMVKAIRQNPGRFRKMLKRKQYFAENNHEEAVWNMMKSGLGRRGRRALCKKMLVKWNDYLLIEDIVMEAMMKTEEMSESIKDGWLERKHQQFLNKAIDVKQLRVAYVVANGYSYDDAMKIVEYGSKKGLGDDLVKAIIQWTVYEKNADRPEKIDK